MVPQHYKQFQKELEPLIVKIQDTLFLSTLSNGQELDYVGQVKMLLNDTHISQLVASINALATNVLSVSIVSDAAMASAVEDLKYTLNLYLAGYAELCKRSFPKGLEEGHELTIAVYKRPLQVTRPSDLMALDRYIKEALSRLGVSKSMGNPVGEYAEYLAVTAFGGRRMANAKEGHDLTLPNGERIEVKGRIFEGNCVPMTYFKHSTIESETFDYLVYIVLDESMAVKYAMKISRQNFKKIAKYAEPSNMPPKWVFLAKPSLLMSPDVIDITAAIKDAEVKESDLGGN